MRLPLQPGLFVATDVPALKCSACTSCGRVSFPPLTIGCDVCGASEDRLESICVPAVGEVYSFARVHVQRGQPTQPFTVAEIALDGGPFIRALVAEGSPALSTGDRVHGVWAVAGIDDAGNDLVEPVFTAVTG
jgi:uncharacterized OB-fold protein